MQAGQYEKLKKLIESSRVLDPAEKSQWLEMLPLMNDKQLFELEGVLNAPAPSPTSPAQNPVPQTQSVAPASNRLSHISNLPTGLNNQRPQQNATATPPQPSPQKGREFAIAAPQAQPALSQVPKPVPSASRITFANQAQRPPQSIQATQATRPPLSSVQVSQSVPNLTKRYGEELLKQKPQASSVPILPKEPMKAGTVSVATPINPAPQQLRPKKPGLDYRNLLTGGPQKISMLSDAQSMTAATFRVLHSSGFLSSLEQLVRTEGYFDVWFAVQQSPLYKLYLHTGEQLLTGSQDESVLSKEEFEALTDIFREMQA